MPYTCLIKMILHSPHLYHEVKTCFFVLQSVEFIQRLDVRVMLFQQPKRNNCRTLYTRQSVCSNVISPGSKQILYLWFWLVLFFICDYECHLFLVSKNGKLVSSEVTSPLTKGFLYSIFLFFYCHVSCFTCI